MGDKFQGFTDEVMGGMMRQLQEDILTLERIASFRVVQSDDDSQVLFRVAARLTALAALSEDAPTIRRILAIVEPLASLTPEQARALAAWMSESAAARERAALTDREYAASFREEGNEARARDYDQQEADELAIAGPRRIASTIFSRLGEP